MKLPNHTRIDLAVIIVLLSSFSLWFTGFFSSMLFHPAQREADLTTIHPPKQDTSNQRRERLLAEAYWTRYTDVGTDSYFGRGGTMGIDGARLHYTTYGKKEGRVFAPLPQSSSAATEQLLAEAYWQRYPDVARSPIWGKKGSLGLLGPRDHFCYRGNAQGRTWGLVSVDLPSDTATTNHCNAAKGGLPNK